MNLRQAAEMALEYFEDAHGLEDAEVAIKEALRQALNETPPCKTDPRAPHGFDRNASHSADRYVCECEGWEPVDAVSMSEERVHKSDKSIHEPVGYVTNSGKSAYILLGVDLEDDTPLYTAPPKATEWVGLTEVDIYELMEFDNYEDQFDFAYAIEAKLKEKNNG